MKQIKSHRLFLPLFIFLLTALPILFSNNAFAMTAGIVNTVGIGGGNSPCPYEDRISNWNDINWWHQSWSYTFNQTNAYNIDTFHTDLQSNIAAGRGWAVYQQPDASGLGGKMITIYLFDPSTNFTVTASNGITADHQVRELDLFLNGNVGCRLQNWQMNATIGAGIPLGDAASGIGYLYVASDNITYPQDYLGNHIPDGSSIDNDHDRLNVIQELQQGTYDSKVDSDGDGIDDLKESQWYTDRDEVFCNKNTTPYTCAYPDPTTKDIYAEIDWMQNSFYNFKPTNTQLSMIASGLGAHGYHVHLDAGEYGGGNALPFIQNMSFAPNDSSIDYFDLKDGNPNISMSGNFNSLRNGVWRYVIFGYNFGEQPTRSGVSYGGSDNTFVSYGLIQENGNGFGYTDFDTAIAGTTIHELGHSLCLSSSQAYSYQSADCIDSMVDAYDSSTYDSVMNYNLQMFQTNYSNGSGSGDHDDWSAIDSQGIRDFTQWSFTNVVMYGRKSNKKERMRLGISIEQAQDAMKKGIYGKVKKGNKIYDLRNKKVLDTSTGQTRDWNPSTHKS